MDTSDIKQRIREWLNALLAYITTNYVWTIFIIIIVLWLLKRVVYALYGPNEPFIGGELQQRQDTFRACPGDKYILKSEIPNAPTCPTCPPCGPTLTDKYVLKSQLLPDQLIEKTGNQNGIPRFFKGFQHTMGEAEKRSKCFLSPDPKQFMGETTRINSTKV